MIIIFRKRRHLFLLVDFTAVELIIPRVWPTKRHKFYGSYWSFNFRSAWNFFS